MKTRLTNEQLKNQLSPETIFIPTFPYLLQCISPKLEKLELEDKIQRRLRKSIGDLPTTLQPILNKPATTTSIAQARILFFEYVKRTELPKKMEDSRTLRRKSGLNRMKLRQYLYRWFVEQIEVHKLMSKKDNETFLVDEKNQQLIKNKSNKLTIAQLLIIEPNIFYILPKI